MGRYSLPEQKAQTPALEACDKGESAQAGELIDSDLDPEVLDRIESVARTTAYAVIQHESHAGPMPSPRDFALYEKVLPGTAQTIRDEFVKNADHMRKMQSEAMQYQKDDNDRNRKSAERLVWGALVVIVVLTGMGHPGAAIAVAVTTVTAVITGFLKARIQKSSKHSDESVSEEDSELRG